MLTSPTYIYHGQVKDKPVIDEHEIEELYPNMFRSYTPKVSQTSYF
jgi:hypothetical protein